MVLRIEDLDAQRCTRTYAERVEADYRALGLFWDEGGSSGGPDGPYYQSRRNEQDVYKRQVMMSAPSSGMTASIGCITGVCAA